jgi:hypothetical protein
VGWFAGNKQVYSTFSLNLTAENEMRMENSMLRGDEKFVKNVNLNTCRKETACLYGRIILKWLLDK